MSKLPAWDRGVYGGTTPPAHQKSYQRSAPARLLVAAIGTALFVATWAHLPWNTFPALFGGPRPPSAGEALETNHPDFHWGSIVPDTTLRYTPCFGDFQCARLLMPLNWNASVEERTSTNAQHLVIAVVKLPAKVPITDPRYGGPILINPGGPGESGVHQALSDGKNLQIMVDAASSPNVPNQDGAKFFDILSFDPRGVNNSEPLLKCFPDSLTQQAWLLRYPDYGLLWDSDSIIGMEWARASALSASCTSVEAGGEQLKYVNAAQVVEDMLDIVEKDAQWRAAEAARLVSQGEISSSESAEEVLSRTAYRPGKDKLQYWGKSYGTVLGSTFSALHPDRVHRIVLDGVVDPADHFSGGWLTQLQTADRIVSKFSEYCYLAGPERCPLFTGSSGKDIEERFTSIMLSLADEPIAVATSVDGKNPSPELVSYGDMHLHLLSALYFSFAYAELFFGLLKSLEGRNTTDPGLLGLVERKQATLAPAACVLRDPFDTCVPYISMMGPNQAISCMDAGGLTNLTRPAFSQYLGTLRDQSRWISRSWARNKLSCLGSRFETAWRPAWSFQTQEWANTSSPLFIIGNSHDTVTPIQNARRVATLFPGSVVLQQASEGHCSHSNPSICTGKAIRAYFQSGSLPAEGAVCEPEVKPFLGCVTSGDEGCQFADPEDEKLWAAMVELADPFNVRDMSLKDSAMSVMHTRRIGHHF